MKVQGDLQLQCEAVLADVAKRYGVSVADIRGRRRLRRHVYARRCACAELMRLGLTRGAVARQVGGLHYASVLYHLRQYEEYRAGLLERAEAGLLVREAA